MTRSSATTSSSSVSKSPAKMLFSNLLQGKRATPDFSILQKKPLTVRSNRTDCPALPLLPVLPALSLAAATDENLRVLAAIEQGRLDITQENTFTITKRCVCVWAAGSRLKSHKASSCRGGLPGIRRLAARQTEREREINKQRGGREMKGREGRGETGHKTFRGLPLFLRVLAVSVF